MCGNVAEEAQGISLPTSMLMGTEILQGTSGERIAPPPGGRRADAPRPGWRAAGIPVVDVLDVACSRARSSSLTASSTRPHSTYAAPKS